MQTLLRHGLLYISTAADSDCDRLASASAATRMTRVYFKDCWSPQHSPPSLLLEVGPLTVSRNIFSADFHARCTTECATNGIVTYLQIVYVHNLGSRRLGRLLRVASASFLLHRSFTASPAYNISRHSFLMSLYTLQPVLQPVGQFFLNIHIINK